MGTIASDQFKPRRTQQCGRCSSTRTTTAKWSWSPPQPRILLVRDGPHQRVRECAMGWSRIQSHVHPGRFTCAANLARNHTCESAGWYRTVPAVHEVLTGYSSYREPCRSSFGWGEDSGQVVLASIDEGGLVRTIWLSVHGVPPERIAFWYQVLQALPRAAELVIADWNSSEVVSLADESALVAYLGRYHA